MRAGYRTAAVQQAIAEASVQKQQQQQMIQAQLAAQQAMLRQQQTVQHQAIQQQLLAQQQQQGHYGGMLPQHPRSHVFFQHQGKPQSPGAQPSYAPSPMGDMMPTPQGMPGEYLATPFGYPPTPISPGAQNVHQQGLQQTQAPRLHGAAAFAAQQAREGINGPRTAGSQSRGF